MVRVESGPFDFAQGKLRPGPTQTGKVLKLLAGCSRGTRRNAIPDVAGFAGQVAAGFFAARGSQQQTYSDTDAQTQQCGCGSSHHVAVLTSDDVTGPANAVSCGLVSVLCSRAEVFDRAAHAIPPRIKEIYARP